MKNLNELINAVLAEAKKQEEQRKEYISLVHQLIEGTERINCSNSDKNNTWRINFRIYTDIMNQTFVSFSQSISKREDGNPSKYDLENLGKANTEIDECINYLYDYNVKVLDSFIEHLSKVAIPQFLQNRYPSTWRVK